MILDPRERLIVALDLSSVEDAQAMVASLGVYAAVRLPVELWLRPHFGSPRTVSYSFFGPYPRSGFGDWILSTRTVDRAGHLLSRGAVGDLNLLSRRCPGLIPAAGRGSIPGRGAVQTCIHRIGLHVQSMYQPGSRYWEFQGIETALFGSVAERGTAPIM